MCAIGLALCGIGGLFVANQSELVVRIVGALMVFTVGMSVAFMNTPFGIYMQKTVPTKINGAGVFNRDVVEYDIHSNRHSFLFLYFSVFSNGIIFIASGMLMLGVTGLTMPKFIHTQMPDQDESLETNQ